MMNNMILSLLVHLGCYYFCCSATMSWDYILKPTIALLSTNVVGQVFVCFFMYLFLYTCTVIITNCIKATINASINAIQWLIDDMGGVFNAILFIIVMIIGSPFFLVYDAACRIYDMVYDFFIIEEDHLKIISVYMTVLQIITCPLWNIIGFLIKTMMNAYAYASATDADGSGSGSGSIPDLTPATPERPRRRSAASASEYHSPRYYRRNGYTEVEPTSPVVVNDSFYDLDKVVANMVEKISVSKSNIRCNTTPVFCSAFTAPAPITTTPVPTTASAQEPAPTAPAAPRRARKAVIVRRTFVDPITAGGTTVQLSCTKRSQRWCMTNEESHDDDYNVMDRSRSSSRMKVCTDEEYFKEIAEIAFPIDEFFKKKNSRPFNKETPPSASSVPFHEEQQQQQQQDDETIIVETVADGDYTYMSPPKNSAEAQKQIDLFDNFQDKDAIWNYIESVWEDDCL